MKHKLCQEQFKLDMASFSFSVEFLKINCSFKKLIKINDRVYFVGFEENFHDMDQFEQINFSFDADFWRYDSSVS